MTDVVDAVRRALALIEQMPDATDRAMAAGELLKAWPELHRDAREIRRQAVLVMRQQGMSHAEVGVALGVSRARAQQIAEGRVTGKRAEADDGE